jgi:hypothetical protein
LERRGHRFVRYADDGKMTAMGMFGRGERASA